MKYGKLPWIATYSGKQWYVTQPRPKDVDIEDIAHGLSLLCRFGGQCREFYSVAQHSVHVLELVERKYPAHPKPYLQLYALLHDASEAYLGDVVRPLKQALPGYREIEEKTSAAIWKKFGIFECDDFRSITKRADDALLMTERRDLVNHAGHLWAESKVAKPLEKRLRPWTSQGARAEFLLAFERLRK